jgi:hypothetical protein
MVPRAPAGMVHGVEDGEKHVKPKQGDTIAIKLQRNGEWLVEIWVGDACIHSTTHRDLDDALPMVKVLGRAMTQ